MTDTSDEARRQRATDLLEELSFPFFQGVSISSMTEAMLRFADEERLTSSPPVESVLVPRPMGEDEGSLALSVLDDCVRLAGWASSRLRFHEQDMPLIIEAMLQYGDERAAIGTLNSDTGEDPAIPPVGAIEGVEREAIARIMDPEAWRLIDHWRAKLGRRDLGSRIDAKMAPSLAKADAILSLIPSTDRMREIAERLVGQEDEPCWTDCHPDVDGSYAKRMNYWRDKAIYASRDILAALSPTPEPEGVTHVEQ